MASIMQKQLCHAGISARQRKAELERLNEQLRKINMSLRQQARFLTPAVCCCRTFIERCCVLLGRAERGAVRPHNGERAQTLLSQRTMRRNGTACAVLRSPGLRQARPDRTQGPWGLDMRATSSGQRRSGAAPPPAALHAARPSRATSGLGPHTQCARGPGALGNRVRARAQLCAAAAACAHAAAAVGGRRRARVGAVLRVAGAAAPESWRGLPALGAAS
jgi:hypothetical protein